MDTSDYLPSEAKAVVLESAISEARPNAWLWPWEFPDNIKGDSRNSIGQIRTGPECISLSNLIATQFRDDCISNRASLTQ